MARCSYALALVGLVGAVALGGACSDAPARVGLVMRAPQGLLDDATEVTLSVIDAGQVTCDEQLGTIAGTPSGDGVQSFPLERQGCAAEAGWCRTITLDRDGATKVFSVQATGVEGVLGAGCTTAVIDQDPLEVSIQIQKFNQPKCCGDGQLQAGEQCDTGVAGPPCGGDVGEPGCTGIEANPVCDCDCLSREILLSIDNGGGGPPLTNGAPGTKTDLALTFSGTSGAVSSSLRAVYVDHDSTSYATPPDINIRLLQPDLYPFPEEPPMASLAGQLRLPSCTSVANPLGIPRTQATPAAAMIRNDTVGVVYSSDEMLAGRPDTFLSLQLGSGCADEDPIRVNQGRDEGTILPDIARGADGTALIVWLDGGAVRGRIWSAGTLTPADTDIAIGAATPNTRARVAGASSGWVVVYEEGSNVWLHQIALTGSVGPRQQVNLVGEGIQDQPDVAMLGDGRSAVVWHSNGQIFAQRYDGSGQPNATDQEAPLGLWSPPSWAPAVAGTDEGGGAFAVVWAADDGAVWARFLQADEGFAFNSVTGQNDDFMASHPAVPGQRSLPAVAIGGAGLVAIGWQDAASTTPGVWVRAFPLPE